MKLKYWEIYFLELIRDQRKGFFAGLIKLFLQGLSWIFQFVVACRNWAFDHGWLRRYSPPVPLVISVGNIVAGGTGKTPVTMMLAKEFYQDFTLAILSRGYRSKAETLSTPVWLSKGQGPMHPASYSGDEPFLLAHNLPKALVFVGRDRHKASNMAAKAGAQLILLDDGMQHRRLARDFEVVVMDARDPFGRGYFLPRGFLREGLKSLGRANLIILNNIHNEDMLSGIKQQIAQYSKAPLIATRVEVAGVFNFDGKPIETLKGKKVGLFCGIAHPDYFENTVRGEGAQIVGHHVVPDHMAFDHEALVAFAASCKEQGAELLLCTEKDKVKFNETILFDLPAAWVQTRLKITEGLDDWQKFIHTAKEDIIRRT